jgi:hypothetical protein
VKFVKANSTGETNLPRCKFFLLNIQAKKRVKLMPVDFFSEPINEFERTRSLNDLFNFEYEKSLTMESVEDVLLVEFNECEVIRSLGYIFNFREFEKSLTMDSLGVPFS